VGCPVACSFCATGQSGFFRSLEVHEIVGQVLGSEREVQRRLKAAPDERMIANVVYMGMGEPLFNYDQVLQSIHLLNDPKGINIGQRHITLSTAGEVNGIEKLSREDLQITLAISLHAANDRLRDRLIPLNRKYPIETLLAAVEKYIARTGRRVTFEYLLLDGVNIAQTDAEDLIRLLKPLLANINLIPYNEIEASPFRQPGRDKVMRFYNYLKKNGMQVTLREERGADIDAACGQLAVRGV
jgi:23S rRNA (adenine2503-C2)-methyltransferase